MTIAQTVESVAGLIGSIAGATKANEPMSDGAMKDACVAVIGLIEQRSKGNQSIREAMKQVRQAIGAPEPVEPEPAPVIAKSVAPSIVPANVEKQKAS